MEIKVEEKNKKNAEIIKNIYTSKFSDLTMFLLYKYESYLFSTKDSYFSKNMNKLSKDSLIHFEILGRIIYLLGGTPDHIDFKVHPSRLGESFLTAREDNGTCQRHPRQNCIPMGGWWWEGAGQSQAPLGWEVGVG